MNPKIKEVPKPTWMYILILALKKDSEYIVEIYVLKATIVEKVAVIAARVV